MRGDVPADYPFPVERGFAPTCDSGECGRCKDCYWRAHPDDNPAGCFKDDDK